MRFSVLALVIGAFTSLTQEVKVSFKDTSAAGSIAPHFKLALSAFGRPVYQRPDDISNDCPLMLDTLNFRRRVCRIQS